MLYDVSDKDVLIYHAIFQKHEFSVYFLVNMTHWWHWNNYFIELRPSRKKWAFAEGSNVTMLHLFIYL